MRLLFVNGAFAFLLLFFQSSVYGNSNNGDHHNHYVNISSGELSVGINAFSSQTGIQILYKSELVHGFVNPEIVAENTAYEILKKLLRDTDLAFRFINERTVIIKNKDAFQKVQDDDPNYRFNIPEIIAVGQGQHFACCNGSSSVSTKVNVPLKEIPKSSESINTDEGFANGNITSSDFFYDDSSVVVTDKTGNLALRGFALSERSILKSGVPAVARGITDIPLANVASIEVAKGSSSSLYGYGQPNGLLNLQLKEPENENFADIRFYGGNYDLGLSSDINIAVSENTSARINGLVHEEETENDSVINQIQIAPSLKFDLGTNTELIIHYEHQSQEVKGGGGVRAFERPIDVTELYFNLIVPNRREVDFYPSSVPSKNDLLEFQSDDLIVEFNTDLGNGWESNSKWFYGEAESESDQVRELNIWLNSLIVPRFGYQPIALTSPFTLEQNQTNSVTQFLSHVDSNYDVPPIDLDIETFITQLAGLAAFIPGSDSQRIDDITQATLSFLSERDTIFDVMSLVYGDVFENVDRWGDGEIRYYYNRSATTKTNRRQGFEFNVTKQFTIGKTDHNVLVGVSYLKKETESLSFLYYNKELYDKGTQLIEEGDLRLGFELRRLSYVNWYNPYSGNASANSTLPHATVAELGGNTLQTYPFDSTIVQVVASSETESMGVYLQDFISLTEEWKLLAAFGYYQYQRKVAHSELNSFAFLTGDRIYIDSDVSPKDDFITPSLGITYIASPNASLYLHYGTQYDVIEGASILNEYFEPEKTHTYEVGAKWDGDNTFKADFAYYQLYKTNWLTHDASNNGFIQQHGKLSGNGWELNTSGFLTPFVEIGFSHAENKVTLTGTERNCPINRIGQPSSYSNAFLTYHSNELGVIGWSTGLGLQYIGERDYNYQDLAFSLDSSMLLNAYITHRGEDFLTAFSIDNITNEDWFVGAGHKPVNSALPNYLAPGYGTRLRLIFEYNL